MLLVTQTVEQLALRRHLLYTRTFIIVVVALSILAVSEAISLLSYWKKLKSSNTSKRSITLKEYLYGELAELSFCDTLCVLFGIVLCTAFLSAIIHHGIFTAYTDDTKERLNNRDKYNITSYGEYNGTFEDALAEASRRYPDYKKDGKRPFFSYDVGADEKEWNEICLVETKYNMVTAFVYHLKEESPDVNPWHMEGSQMNDVDNSKLNWEVLITLSKIQSQGNDALARHEVIGRIKDIKVAQAIIERLTDETK